MHAASRPLTLDPSDGRPESALGIHWLSAFTLVAGLVTSVLIPLFFALLVLVCALFASLVETVVEALTDEPSAAAVVPELEEEEVIQARFVMLGRELEHELPNREVPVLSMAPPEPAEVPTEQTPSSAEPVQRVQNRPPNTVRSLLTRLDHRAELFEEMSERRLMEGSPEGIDEGTERQGSEGDLYRGRLYSFFRRGWTVPTTLSRDEIRGLTVVMNVAIGADLGIVSFDVRNASANALYDESVVQQLTRLQASGQHIPPPPEEVAEQYIGRTIAVRFRGREAGR